MRPDPARLASLAAVLTKDLEAIDRLDAELRQMLPGLQAAPAAFRDLAAAAYTLHAVYTALENTFDQISRTFENHVVDPRQWHRELLRKMFLEIPGVRPAVLPEELRSVLTDLRGFRHVFRHAYDLQLDPERLCRLAAAWQRSKAELVEALRRFRTHLLPEVR